MNTLPLLSILTFVPVVGAIVLFSLGSAQARTARTLAVALSLLELALALVVWIGYDPVQAGFQFSEGHEWGGAIGGRYLLGVDGMSAMLVLLTGLVTPLAILATPKVEDKGGPFFALVLLLQAGLFGTFTALNFLHWFLFWELSLVPAFFLIKMWGGQNRGAAATQFFVYTMVGSIAMLLSFLAIYGAAKTFDFQELARRGANGELKSQLAQYLHWGNLPADKLALLVFGGVFLGFAVKVPLVPFHTWLPLAYSEAPTSVTMLLTGLMSKMGVYGFLRICLPLFPEQMRMVLTPLLWLAVATIVFSAGAAFAQKDLKRILAYSSINHLGYCLLGVFALSSLTGTDAPWNIEKSAVTNGVLLQMFNHGLTAPILFCFVGFVEQRSGGLRGLNDFGGLRKVAPVFCGFMGIALFASLGLPGLNGFIGEFLIFKGAFALTSWATSLAVLGLLLTAVFLLTLLQRVFTGPVNPRWKAWPDLSSRELLLVVPATALMFVIGIYPQLLIGKINSTVLLMVDQLKF